MEYVSLVDGILNFILLLYGLPNLPRNIIDVVIEFLNNFIKNVVLKSLEHSI